jgi:hypothetical protein
VRFADPAETIRPDSLDTLPKPSANPAEESDKGKVESSSPQDTQQSVSPDVAQDKALSKPSPNLEIKKHDTTPEGVDVVPSSPKFVCPKDIFNGFSEEQITDPPYPTDLHQYQNSTATNGFSIDMMSQYTHRLWTPCDTALARRIYNELDDISVRINAVIRGISGLMGEADLDSLGDLCSCSSGEDPCTFTEVDDCAGASEDTWAVADEENLLVLSSDEETFADE